MSTSPSPAVFCIVKTTWSVHKVMPINEGEFYVLRVIPAQVIAVQHTPG